MPFEMLERLASWGSRYAQICRTLEPFTVVLYAALRKQHRAGLIQWSTELRAAVELFRSLLSLSVLRRAQFSRPFDTFRVNPPLDDNSFLVECDASLTGLGILIYRWVPGLQEWAPFGGSPPISIAQWKWAGKSEFQNTSEFIACVMGITLLHQYHVCVSSVSIRGDSATAGRWGATRRARSLTALNAAVVYTLVMLKNNVDIAEFYQITSAENWRCDLLSRQGSWDELVSRDNRWRSIQPKEVKGCSILLKLCHPNATWVSTREGWELARRVVKIVCN